MYETILRINKLKHVYIPKHKQWVKLYRQKPLLIRPSEEELETISEWMYQVKQIPYDVRWEGNTLEAEEEETTITPEQHIYNNFDKIWSDNE